MKKVLDYVLVVLMVIAPLLVCLVGFNIVEKKHQSHISTLHDFYDMYIEGLEVEIHFDSYADYAEFIDKANSELIHYGIFIDEDGHVIVSNLIKEKEEVKEVETYSLYILKLDGEELEFSRVVNHEMMNNDFLHIEFDNGEIAVIRFNIDELEMMVIDR